MKKVPTLFFIGLISLSLPAWAVNPFATNTRNQPGYFENLLHNWGRGLVNIISAPLEIPLTIKKYHQEDPGLSGVRHIAGFTDGIFRTFSRAGSGVWDLAVSLIPGEQEGAPVKPETLFKSTDDHRLPTAD